MSIVSRVFMPGLLLIFMGSGKVMADEWSISLGTGLKYFFYKETIGGFELDREEGWIPVISVQVMTAVHDGTLSLSAELATGTIDYDGHSQSLEQGGEVVLEPHKTKSGADIYRWSLAYDQPLRRKDGQLSAYWVSELSINFWERDVYSNDGVAGVYELYQWGELALGLRYPWSYQAWQGQLSMMITHTLDAQMKLDGSVFGTDDLIFNLQERPGMAMTVLLNSAAGHAWFITYKVWAFGESPAITVGDAQYLEPDSTSEILQLGMRYNF